MTRLLYLADEQSPHGNPELALDLEAAPGYMLFFSCFMGDVDLSLGGVEFSTNFGWVSTLGFALAFLGVVDELPVEGESKVSFQEDTAWIRLQRSRDRVHVSCSYSTNEQTVAYEELLGLSRVGLRDLLDTLYLRFPALERNQTLRDSLGQVGLI
jgi:hypothetical protein